MSTSFSFRGRGAADPLLRLQHLRDAAERIDPPLPVHLVHAIADVEAPRGGYLPDGRLAMLFEAHHFSRLTGRRFDADHPTISTRRWDRRLYWGGAAEYVRLERAMALDATAAVMAASWGAGQIMGFNAAACGYADVWAMLAEFRDDPGAHALAIVRFIEKKGALPDLRGHRFVPVARVYNGPRFAEHGYHLRLSTAAAARAGSALAGLAAGEAGGRVLRLQQALADAGCSPGAIDGAFGPRTAGALLAWQAREAAPHPLMET